MADTNNFIRWATITLSLPWFEIAGKMWKIGRKVMRGLANEGVYEVLDYESTLELKDRGGKRAVFRKREKVRYQQDSVIAYQDHGWGDGKILINYRTSRGKAVDRYRAGYKTYILLSLREVKNRGNIDEFNIAWDIRNGFLTEDGYWSTDITNQTRRIKINVIFPKSRPPSRLTIEENNRQRTHILNKDAQKRLPDGRWRVTWETNKPRLYEVYVLRWIW